MSSEGSLITIGPIYSQITKLNAYLNNEQLAARIVGKRIFQTSAGIERKGRPMTRKHRQQLEVSRLSADLEAAVNAIMQNADPLSDNGLSLSELSAFTYAPSGSSLWPIFKYYFQRQGYSFKSTKFFEDFGMEASKGILSNPPLSNARVTFDIYHEDKFRNRLFQVLANEFEIIRRAAEYTVRGC